MAIDDSDSAHESKSGLWSLKFGRRFEDAFRSLKGRPIGTADEGGQLKSILQPPPLRLVGCHETTGILI